MRKLFAILAAVSVLAVGAPAQAALVATNAILSVAIQGLAPLSIAGTGFVDVTGSTVTVPAGLVTLTGALIVPVTGVTSVVSLSVPALSHLSGVFSRGGVPLSEKCPLGGPVAPGSAIPPIGQACNNPVGHGGGIMALTGTINVNILPGIVVIPVNLTAALIGQGGSTNAPFSIDAAVWTTGTGLVNTGINISGLVGGNAPFTLVTPTFVSAIGNLLPIFAVMTLTNISHNIPEPGSILLIGSGIAGLVLLGSRRK